MFRQVNFLALLMAIVMLVGCSTSKGSDIPPLVTDQNGKIALALVADVMGGNYKAAVEDYNFSPEMDDAMSQSVLYMSMFGLVTTYGKFDQIESIDMIDGSYYIGVNFERGKSTFVVAFDQDVIVSFWLNEYIDPETLAPVLEKTLPEGVIEHDVLFGSPQITGKMVVVPESTVAVILIGGSGPQDADSTVGPNKPMRDIAYDLASLGISSLRYAKRTTLYTPDQLGGVENFTPYDEYVYDAVAAYDYIRTNKNAVFDNIYIAGHSMGGYMLPQIATEIEGESGYIFLAASYTDLPTLMIEQTDYLSQLDEMTVAQKDLYQEIKEAAQQIVAGAESLPQGEPILGAYPAYWKWLEDYDVTSLVNGVDTPILFLSGDRDYQVPISEMELWREALSGGDVELVRLYHTLEGLNHLFMWGDAPSSPNEYMYPGIADQSVAQNIASFISGLSGQ